MSMFIVLHSGDPLYWGAKEDALIEAHMMFNQYVSDFLRHSLPKKLSENDVSNANIRVFELRDGTTEIIPPFQEWIDAYYDETRKNDKDDEEREYKRYLELHEKHEGRRLREEKEIKPQADGCLPGTLRQAGGRGID